jgi:hypothetical protein
MLIYNLKQTNSIKFDSMMVIKKISLKKNNKGIKKPFQQGNLLKNYHQMIKYSSYFY